MIPKASQRSGGQQLATHLLNAYDNDRVEVADVRGAIAQDLHGAFAEWSAIASATKCRKYLYSLSVNPDPEQGPLTREQYKDFVARTERKLGLGDQPRAMVFHVKHGREHCHVVWSRIDSDRLRAVQLSHDRHKLSAVVREFARDHGLELPAGMTRGRGGNGQPRRRAENLAEQQQEERTGESREERMRAITAAWRTTGTGQQFVRALQDRGYVLARGAQRAYVVIDRFGEIHSLSRQIEGVRSKEVKARLGDFPLEGLPEAETVRQQATVRRNAVTVRQDFQEAAEEKRAALAIEHERRRRPIDEKRKALGTQHTTEREALHEAQEAENTGVASARLRGRPQGLLGFLARITGIKSLTEFRQRRQDQARSDEHARQRDALQRRHDRELADFQRHYRALHKVETRERRSLETTMRRAAFQRAAQPPRAPEPGLTAAQRSKLERVRENAAEITTPRTALRQPPSPTSRIAREFGEKASAAEKQSPKRSADKARESAERLSGSRQTTRDTGPPPTSAKPDEKLKDTFNDSAEDKARELLEEWKARQKTRPPGPDRDRER